MHKPWQMILLVCGLLMAASAMAEAHEIDQFSMPAGKEFVDLGYYWNDLLFTAVHKGVEQTNAEIEKASQIKDPAKRQAAIDGLHTPDAIAKAVFEQNRHAYFMIEDLEKKLYDKKELAKHPGQILGFKAPVSGCVYSRPPVLPDPRQFVRTILLRCSTVKVHGTYMGTDKIGHFYGMGYYYYEVYREKVLGGASVNDAAMAAMEYGRSGPMAEKGVIGSALAGIYSNGDMAANYLGMKFYINLTDPVQLKGRIIPPMLTRDGDLWRLRQHVSAEGQLFSMYVSNHMNEALNPCLYDWGMRGPIKTGLKYRSKDLLDIYAGEDPAKRNPEYFNRMLQSFTTYWGEDYGHSGRLDDLVTIGNSCFEAPPVAANATKAGNPFQRAAARFKPRF